MKIFYCNIPFPDRTRRWEYFLLETFQPLTSRLQNSQVVKAQRQRNRSCYYLQRLMLAQLEQQPVLEQSVARQELLEVLKKSINIRSNKKQFLLRCITKSIGLGREYRLLHNA